MSRRNVEELASSQGGRADLSVAGFDVDILDLSRLTSEFGRQIHPCGVRIDSDAAVSLAMQLLSELLAWPDRRLDE